MKLQREQSTVATGRGRGWRAARGLAAALLVVAATFGCSGEIVSADAPEGTLEQAARTLPATLTADPAIAQSGGAPYTLTGSGFVPSMAVRIKAYDPSRSWYETTATADGTVSWSGTTNGPGLYKFYAYQKSGKRQVLMARTTMSVVAPEVCGDALCNGTETCSSCPADCGDCPALCGNGACEASETCSSCAADCGECPAACGDGACNGAETCSTCPVDCGACPPVCGDGQCAGGETCSSCPADCGACPPACGDGTCNGTETCSSCPADCGACPPACGDGTCNGTETCSSCPADCGVCPPVCGDGTCNGTETCSSCAADCGTCNACIPAATTLPNGQHNAGRDCMGCHVAGGAASSFPWTIAGTLYNDAAGTAAVSGATVRVTDATGAVIDLVTASNGNFYTLQSVKFPIKPLASRCPDTVQMSSQPATGACNSCHAAGFRVHLP